MPNNAPGTLISPPGLNHLPLSSLSSLTSLSVSLLREVIDRALRGVTPQGVDQAFHRSPRRLGDVGGAVVLRVLRVRAWEELVDLCTLQELWINSSISGQL